MPSAISAGASRFPLENILEEIAQHAERNPDWLERSAP